MMPHLMGPRPLFPAVPSTAIAQQKPTFPAYSNATISAPPKTNTGGSTSTSTTPVDTQKPPTIPQQNTGTASKIMHPSNDLSLEELKARKPQYKVNKTSTASPQSSASHTPTSTSSILSRPNESKLLAAAQEVSPWSLILYKSFHTNSPFLFHYFFYKIIKF